MSPQPSTHDVVVAGASAGGVEALAQFLAPLPTDYRGTILVVLHVSGTSLLPQILDRRCDLPVTQAEDDGALEPGRVYVAPPDRHLVLQNDHMRLTRGPRENGHRPAIDPLMRSAAGIYGDRVIGVILSGTRADGSAGLHEIKLRGGLAIVQDPAEAAYPGMPQRAIEFVDVDHVLPAGSIAAVLTGAARAGRPAPHSPAGADPSEDPDGLDHGPYECPDCGGMLRVHESGGAVWLECRVGHRYDEQSLLAQQGPRVEAALWAAIRSLEERAELLRRMAERATSRRQTTLATRSARQAADLEAHARSIRHVVGNAGLEEPEVTPETHSNDAGEPEPAGAG